MRAPNRPAKPLKIALSGAHGTGKTTLINAITAACEERNIQISRVDEIPRLIADSVSDPAFFRQGSNTFAKQSLILQGQLHAELRAFADSADVILCDRALLDHWIYTIHFHTSSLEQSQVTAAYASMVAQHCRSYDLIFYLPIEFPPVDDGTREADLGFQAAIDEGIRTFLDAQQLTVVTLNGGVSERCALAVDSIERQLAARVSASSNVIGNRAPTNATRIGVSSIVDDADAAYRAVLVNLLATDHEVKGSITKSVGSERRSKEILHYNIAIQNPRERLIWNSIRKLDLPVAVARFVWMMGGNDRLKDIAFYQEKVARFSDDGIVVPGSSYGHRMIYPAPGCNQIKGVIGRLREDTATRRAAIAVYQAEDAVRLSNDIPCTFGLVFHNRGDFLYPSVVMRSNNAFILLPYNIFEFSLLAEAIAAEVGLELGSLTYHALSMHVYSDNYAAAQAAVGADIAESTAPVPLMPKTPAPMDQIRELVKIEADARHAAAGFSAANFESQWLPFADSRLHPYWRQFYYVLLWAMCWRVGFSPGMSRLREFIDQPWLAHLPADMPRTVSQRDLELFPSVGATPPMTRKRRKAVETNTDAQTRPDSSVFSREDLERELARVLKVYQPYVAKDQWSRVNDYRAVFLAKATESPDKLQRVFGRLHRVGLTLREGERTETNRARAEVIIARLEKLIVD